MQISNKIIVFTLIYSAIVGVAMDLFNSDGTYYFLLFLLILNLILLYILRILNISKIGLIRFIRFVLPVVYALVPIIVALFINLFHQNCGPSKGDMCGLGFLFIFLPISMIINFIFGIVIAYNIKESREIPIIKYNNK
ncbi:MAG: hypothetical protein WCK11_02860 [Candidatus Falkowbacteria bacterium]